VAGCFTHLFLRQEHTSFLIYVGDKTYSSIKTTNKRFIDALYPFQPEVKVVPLNKSMFRWLPSTLSGDRFDEVIDFMNVHKVK
jgi:hypothetical protein